VYRDIGGEHDFREVQGRLLAAAATGAGVDHCRVGWLRRHRRRPGDELLARGGRATRIRRGGRRAGRSWFTRRPDKPNRGRSQREGRGDGNRRRRGVHGPVRPAPADYGCALDICVRHRWTASGQEQPEEKEEETHSTCESRSRLLHTQPHTWRRSACSKCRGGPARCEGVRRGTRVGRQWGRARGQTGSAASSAGVGRLRRDAWSSPGWRHSRSSGGRSCCGRPP
jgi:hypothetical protein